MSNTEIYNALSSNGIPGSTIDNFPYKRPTLCLNAKTGEVGIRWEGLYDAVKYLGYHFTTQAQLETLKGTLAQSHKATIERALTILSNADAQDKRTLPVFTPKADTTTALGLRR